MPKVTKSHWDLVNVNQHRGERKKEKSSGREGRKGRKEEKKQKTCLFEKNWQKPLNCTFWFTEDDAVWKQLKWRLTAPLAHEKGWNMAGRSQQKVSAAAQNGLHWPRKAMPPCSPGWVPSHLRHHHANKSQLSFSWFPEWESQPGAGRWASWCTQIPGKRMGRHREALGCKEHLPLHQALLSLGCQTAIHGSEGSVGTSTSGLLCRRHYTIPPTAWVNAFLPYTLPKSSQKPSKPQFGHSRFVFVHLPALTWSEIMLYSPLCLPTAVLRESHRVASHLPLAGLEMRLESSPFPWCSC